MLPDLMKIIREDELLSNRLDLIGAHAVQRGSGLVTDEECEKLSTFNLTIKLHREQFEDCYLLLLEESEKLGLKIQDAASVILEDTLRDRFRGHKNKIDAQEIAYRVFEIIESDIKKAISQAIDEHFKK